MASRTQAQATITLHEAYRRAETALTGGDPARAIALTQHILRFYPHYLDAYRLLGEAYFERAHPDEALRFFSHVLAADPQNVLARVGRAIIADERGQTDLAIDEYEHAFEIDPAIAEVRGELLRLYKTRYGSAGATIRLTPSGLAYVHLRAGLREAAISELGYVAQLRPDRWDIEVALAEALWRNEQLDEAAAVAGDILAGHPTCVKCCWILGYLHWIAGRTDSGRRYLMEAVALDPTYRIAQALWDATPWPLNRAVARVQPAPIPAPSPYDLVGADMDLTLSLPVFVDPADLSSDSTAGVTAEPAEPVAPALVAGYSSLVGDAMSAAAPVPESGFLIADTLVAEDGFILLPALPEEAAAPVAELPALDLGWFDDWASAAETPGEPPAVAGPTSASPAPADVWAQFVAPGGRGDIWAHQGEPADAEAGAPQSIAAPVSAALLGHARALTMLEVAQPPLFAEAGDQRAPMGDGATADLLLQSVAVPDAWQLALELPVAPPAADPAQFALPLPDPVVPVVLAPATLAAEPAGAAGGSAVAPAPDLPTVRVENLSDGDLLDWLLRAQLPAEDAPRAEAVASVELPLGRTSATAGGPTESAESPLDLMSVAATAGGPTESATMPTAYLPVDAAAFSDDDLLDWLIDHAPTAPSGSDGKTELAPPVTNPAALDSATIATLTADDLLDWLTVVTPGQAPLADTGTIALMNGAKVAHNSSEVGYNNRVSEPDSDVSYNHSAPDGVPHWLQQRPPGAPDC